MFVVLCSLQSRFLVAPQVLDPQYGMYVWPCAVVLAQYLWTHRDQLRDQTVLEVRRDTLHVCQRPADSLTSLSVHSWVQV